MSPRTVSCPGVVGSFSWSLAGETVIPRPPFSHLEGTSRLTVPRLLTRESMPSSATHLPRGFLPCLSTIAVTSPASLWNPAVTGDKVHYLSSKDLCQMGFDGKAHEQMEKNPQFRDAGSSCRPASLIFPAVNDTLPDSPDRSREGVGGTRQRFI